MSPPVQNGGRLGNSRIIVRLNEEQIILTPLPHYDPPPLPQDYPSGSVSWCTVALDNPLPQSPRRSDNGATSRPFYSELFRTAFETRLNPAG